MYRRWEKKASSWLKTKKEKITLFLNEYSTLPWSLIMLTPDF